MGSKLADPEVSGGPRGGRVSESGARGGRAGGLGSAEVATGDRYKGLSRPSSEGSRVLTGFAGEAGR